MKVTLVFDVEDPITPESDDVALWLAEILREEGMQATFFVTADKARSLEERGRTDVIEALQWHDIGYHSDTHSIHPTISEYLENAGWNEGVNEVQAREYPAIEYVSEVFDQRPSAFGRTGGSYGPQISPAMAEVGLAYAYSPIAHPTTAIYRFAGVLTFGMHTRGFDDVLADDAAFAARLEEFKRRLNGDFAADRAWLAVFGAHPTYVRATAFWDVVNFERGKNPPREAWQAPPLRPVSDMQNAQANFRTLVRFLSDHPNIEPITVAEICGQYPGPPSSISAAELVRIAATVGDRDGIPVDQVVSPAESLVAFAHVIKYCEITDVERTDVLGPMTDPPAASPVHELDRDQLLSAADAVLAHVEQYGAVPASIPSAGGPIGLASLYGAFAEAVCDLAMDRPFEAVSLAARYPFPEVARDLDVSLPAMMHGWPIHDPALEPDTITAHTKRQTWTLAPVHFAES